MYPDFSLPEPLTHHELYVLLALAQDEHYAYALKGKIIQNSLGSLHCSDGAFFRLLARMHDAELIEMINYLPAGKSGKPRLHYAISELGKIRLQEEYQRLAHALRIIEHAGLAKPKIPTDIHRLLLPRA